MKAFMDETFLLGSALAEKLYYEHSAKMPVIDYHCHLEAEEIAKDIRFENMTQLWLGADAIQWY